MKKSTIIMSSAAFVLFAVLAVKPSVYADESNDFGPMVQKIMSRFGISESDMSATLEEFREENPRYKGRMGGMKGEGMRENREERMQEHLDEMVENGTLTFEQKSALAEIHAKWNGADNDEMSRDERHEAADAHRAEVESWADANGISLDDLHEGQMRGQGRGFDK